MAKKKLTSPNILLQHLLDRTQLVGECLIWRGAVSHSGYGVQWYQGKNHNAHRLLWILTHGDTDLLVCHICDNRLCLNIKHLFLGTYSDNTNDAKRKGRLDNRRGMRNPSSVLSEEEVRVVFMLKNSGVNQRQIATWLNVSEGTVSLILNKKTWKHLKDK